MQDHQNKIKSSGSLLSTGKKQQTTKTKQIQQQQYICDVTVPKHKHDSITWNIKRSMIRACSTVSWDIKLFFDIGHIPRSP